MRNKKFFRKVYKYYIICLFVIMLVCVGGVYHTLTLLEKNQPNVFVENALISLSDLEIKSLFEYNSTYETEEEFLSNIREFFKSGKYEIKKEENLKYGVYLGKDLLLKITLKSNKHVNKLGIFSYDVLELEKIEGKDDKELYAYTITAPSNYQVKINNIALEGGDDTKINGFLDGYEYTEIPTIKKYEIHKLTKEPKIEISNNLGDVSFDDNQNIDLSDSFVKYDTLADAGIDFDVLAFAKNWSLYLTNDLTGPLHGMYTITAYLINGSSMYKKAYQWGTSIDIMFTSRHTLKNPTFTNEKVSNIIVYGDNAFSCDVYLEKNMLVNNQDKVDKFNSTIYFVKYNNEWKIINIKGVTNN